MISRIRLKAMCLTATLLFGCSSVRLQDDGFSTKLDSGCNSFDSCERLVVEAEARTRNCQQNTASTVPCDDTRADLVRAQGLFRPYKRAAEQAEIERQQQLDLQQAQEREARLEDERLAEFQRDQDQRRQEEQRQLEREVAEIEARLRVYRLMTVDARQDYLVKCHEQQQEYREDLHRYRSCGDLLNDLLDSAESEDEQRALVATNQQSIEAEERKRQAQEKALAAEERKRQAREAAQEARERSSSDSSHSSGGERLQCCDGTLSPSCMCAGSHRGCCSHHGGVCGCGG